MTGKVSEKDYTIRLELKEVTVVTLDLVMTWPSSESTSILSTSRNLDAIVVDVCMYLNFNPSLKDLLALAFSLPF